MAEDAVGAGKRQPHRTVGHVDFLELRRLHSLPTIERPKCRRCGTKMFDGTSRKTGMCRPCRGEIIDREQRAILGGRVKVDFSDPFPL